MKLKGFILFALFTSAELYSPEAFGYILRSIEYEASIESGLFRCIFYDISPRDPFRNILGDLLNSPALENTLRYVVTNGSFENKLDKLPWHPSMLLMYPGSDADHLLLRDTVKNIAFILECLNPTTKVLVVVNINVVPLVNRIVNLVLKTGFNSMVFFDPATMVTALFNTVWQIGTLKPPAPMYLFTRLRRKMTGSNVTYLAYTPVNAKGLRYFITLRWLREAARYLDTEINEYQHGCYYLKSKNAIDNCFASKSDEFNRFVDIKLKYATIFEDIPRGFDVLFTTLVKSTRIAVPRDRPLNAFELMLMPFSWQVWMLLLAIFIVSEVAAQLFPDFFRNDPVLLAVCGFERYDLNRARQCEKFLFLSLIVLMFFMSNAFETKIVSLMIDKPSIQQVKTLEDLANSGIKFSGHLDSNPHFVNHSVVGPMIVNGAHYSVYDKVPGFGLYLLQEMAQVLEFTAFDYDRMQPWYVLLDLEFYTGPVMYYLSWRNKKLETFRYIQITLTEAGLTDLWMRQFQYLEQASHFYRRLPQVELNFEDLNLAWVALAIGLGLSTLMLLGEMAKKKFDALLER